MDEDHVVGVVDCFKVVFLAVIAVVCCVDDALFEVVDLLIVVVDQVLEPMVLLDGFRVVVFPEVVVNSFLGAVVIGGDVLPRFVDLLVLLVNSVLIAGDVVF